MRKLGENENAVSSVVGVILMAGLTVFMISAVAISVLGFALPESAPQAKIVMVEAKGDIGNTALYKNIIVLKHKGGDALNENDTKIIIAGKGYKYSTGSDPNLMSAQDMRVTYRDLNGKNHYHNGTDFTSKQIVSGTSWDAGEQIELYGRDGIQDNSVDSKWKLDDGSTVSVTIIDTSTNQVIAVSRATVKHA